MTQDHKSAKRNRLWIAAVILLALGNWADTVLADLREVAQSSEARNRIYFQTLSLTESDERARVIGKSALPEIPPGLSWRVAILPLMDEQELYDKFHLDEPWDSQHNKQLIEQMPPDLNGPGASVEPGKSCFIKPVKASGLRRSFLDCWQIRQKSMASCWIVPVQSVELSKCRRSWRSFGQSLTSFRLPIQG